MTKRCAGFHILTGTAAGGLAMALALLASLGPAQAQGTGRLGDVEVYQEQENRTLGYASIYAEGGVSWLGAPSIAFGRDGESDGSGLVKLANDSFDPVLGAGVGLRPFPTELAAQLRFGFSRRRFQYKAPTNPDVFFQRNSLQGSFYRIPVDMTINTVSAGIVWEPLTNPTWYGIGLLPMVGFHFHYGTMERGDAKSSRQDVWGPSFELGFAGILDRGLVVEFGARTLLLGKIKELDAKVETVPGDREFRLEQDLTTAEGFIRLRLDL